MSSTVLNTSLAAAALAITTIACSGGAPAPAATTPPPNAKRVDETTAGSVTGKVTFEGAAPASAPIKLDSDPACAQQHPGGLPPDSFVVSNGGLENVFVYVKDGLGDYYFETPTTAVTLDQKGCHYTPHVFGVRAGQPLEIVNSDPTLHNVHAMAKVNQSFNLGQAIQGMKNQKVFKTPEVMVHIQVRRAQLDERLRGRPRSSVLRGHGQRRQLRAERAPAGDLHCRSLARETRHADAKCDAGGERE